MTVQPRDRITADAGGQLTIQMRGHDIVLGPRELFVVPRGIEHCPRADTETAVLLLELVACPVPSTAICGA
jgi:mannose-6-phosphate isomerase-like protein (cupin superfamily)